MSKATPRTNVTVEFDADLHIKPIQFADQLGIRPQMVYNYIKNGRFPEGVVVEAVIRTERTVGEGEDATVEVKERSQKVLVREHANEWAEQYTAKKAAREAKRAEQLEKELAGEA